VKVCAYCRNTRPIAAPECPTCGAQKTIPHFPTLVQINELLRLGRVSINEVREYFGLCAISDPHFDARKT
jgi:hypothetical protein